MTDPAKTPGVGDAAPRSTPAPEAPAPRRRGLRPAALRPQGAPPGAAFLIVLSLVTFVGPLSLHMFFPAIPAVRAAFGVSEAVAQLGASLPMFTMAFLTLVYGSLSDRLGRRPVLMAGVLLFTVGGVIAALATSVWVLLAGRLIQAAGGACGLALARAIARDVYGADRLVKAIAYLTMAYALGPMLATPVSGLLVDMLGWRSVLIFAAGTGVVLLGLAYVAIFETHTPAARATEAGRGAGWWANHVRLLRDPRFTAFVLQGGFSASVFFAMATGSAFLMTEYLKRPAAEFGLYFPLFPLGFVIGNFCASRLTQRASVETMVLAASLLLTIGVAVQAAIILGGGLSPAAIFVPGFFITFALGLGAANAQAGAIRAAGSLAGTAAGVGVFASMMGGGLFSQLFGLLADGTPVPFVVTVALAAGMALAAGVAAFALRIRPGSAAVKL